MRRAQWYRRNDSKRTRRAKRRAVNLRKARALRRVWALNSLAFTRRA